METKWWFCETICMKSCERVFKGKKSDEGATNDWLPKMKLVWKVFRREKIQRNEVMAIWDYLHWKERSCERVFKGRWRYNKWLIAEGEAGLKSFLKRKGRGLTLRRFEEGQRRIHIRDKTHWWKVIQRWKTKTKTKAKTMTKTITFKEHLQRAIPETCFLWDIWSEWWGDMT